MFTTITGKEFNERTKGIRYVKLISEKRKNDFSIGMNEDDDRITFCSEDLMCDHIFSHVKLANFPKYMMNVLIPDNANVFVYELDSEQHELKTDKIILDKPRSIIIYNMELCVASVIKHGRAFKYVAEQTEELCKLAIIRDKSAFKYVAEQTEELCKLAVIRDGMLLGIVKKQTDELCKIAVVQNGNSLKYVKKQTEEICKIAVQQNGNSLKYVKKQTEEICKIAVRQNGNSLKYVKKQTDEICKIAVRNNKDAIIYIKCPTMKNYITENRYICYLI